jgi:hypothetical protein
LIILDEVEDVLAYGARVPLLYLACVEVHPFLVDLKDCVDISRAQNLVMLTEELQGHKEVI